jgi:hypothetical protein
MSLLEGNPEGQQPVMPEEVKIHLSPKDSAALKITLQDFEKSEQWLASKQWALRWKEAQLRYEPLREYATWENTTVPRSNLNVYTVAQITQSIMSKVMEGLFSDDPPFIVQPRPKTSQETARAITALLHYQTEDCGFRQEIEDGASDAVLFGTNIWKVNWKELKRVRRVYKRNAAPVTIPAPMEGADKVQLHTEESDELTVQKITEDYGQPIIESQDLFTTYVAPGLRNSDIRKAKYVISKINVSAAELDDMRGWEGYDIPSEKKLMELLFPRDEHAPLTQLETLQTSGTAADHQAEPRWYEETADPTEDSSRFEILERWDKDKVVAVLNRKLVIRNEENPFGKLPYFSVGWWRVPNSFYSIGVGVTCGDEQQIQRGIINAVLDELAWNLNLPVLRVRGKDAPSQNIRMMMGRFIDVEDVNHLKPMERMQAVPEAYAEIQASQARAEGSSGANELMVQGSTPAQGRTSLGRTATGANLLAGGSGARLESFVERIADQVIVPALDMFFEMDKQLLEPEQLRGILNDEMDQAWEGDDLDILNARVSFDVLAASRMVARQRMAQSLPILAQSLLTDPMHAMLSQQGKKLEVNELVNMWFDISGWKSKSSLIVDMTEEDKTRLAMQNPAMQQMMAQKAKTQAETDSKLQILDADNAARAYREINRQLLEKALTPDLLSGNPQENANVFGGGS